VQPVTEFAGPALTFDLAGVEVGVAEYEEGPTGCTVLRFPEGAHLAVDVRGGANGVVGADYSYTHAICLAGGSLPGLTAAAGVSAVLHEGLTGPLRWGGASPFRLVSGAIIYDFARRDSAIYPDTDLGAAAAKAARPGWFPLGERGAGRSAAVGKFLFGDEGAEPGGQGAAFRQIGETKLLVCTVVNAVGGILDREGRVVRGHRDPETGRRLRALEAIESGARPAPPPRDRNTTLTVVVTNAAMRDPELQQFGRMVHTSMVRAIDPFHTTTDGDVLFAVATGEVESSFGADALSLPAAELAWDAVLAAVEAQQ